jgi:hypothetical protein
VSGDGLRDELDPERTKLQAFCMEDNCGSSVILFDAHSVWNYDQQAYELLATYDKGCVCNDCGVKDNIDWQEVEK